jgi:hypothetical protein
VGITSSLLDHKNWTGPGTGTDTDITPPNMHAHVLMELATGSMPWNVVREGGAQVVGIRGVHGIGVSAPIAAAVALATAGLAGLRHRPNGRILTTGVV